MTENKKYDCSENQAAQVTRVLDAKTTWKHLFAFTARSHICYLAGAGLSSAAVAALRTGLAIILGRVFDVVAAFGNGQKTGQEALTEVSHYCVILAALGAVQWISNSAFLALWIIFGEQQVLAVRLALFPGLLNIGKAWLDSLPQGTSGLVATIQRKTHELQVATSQVLGYLVADILTALASLAVAFYTSWKLTLVLLATLPVALGLLFITSHKIQPAIKNQTAHLSSASKTLAGSLAGIDLVKLCGGYAQETQTYMMHILRAATQYRFQARLNSIQIGYTGFWAISMFVIGFWYGLSLVQQGESPGKVLTTFYAVLATMQGIESLLPNWLVFEKGMNAGQVLQALKAELADPEDSAPEAIRPGYFVGAIDLKDVNFTYPTTPTVPSLEQCSLAIPAGEFTVLVGRSGSGKTTIANLITRTYDALCDSISIDGIPIKRLQQKWIQQHILLVEQTPVIFNDTLFRNIVLGHRDPSSVTYHQVLQACQVFGLEPVITALTGGLHAIIGGKRCPLSGGQKQRIALARAYLCDPAILILDESVSALDQISRELIMNQIRTWRRGKTTVVISHDLDRLQHDDFVYVLDKGKVTESGFKQTLELNSLGAFLTAALEETALYRSANIEINVISPITEDVVQDFPSPRRPRSPTHAHSWLRSRSNSSIYSSASIMSPGMSFLASPIRRAPSNATASPRLPSRSGLASPSALGSPQLLRPPDGTTVSSFISRQFQATPWKTSFDMNGSQVQPQPQPAPASPALDLESIYTGTDAGDAKPRKRRLVQLGILHGKKKPSSLSFYSIIGTVLPHSSILASMYLVLGIVVTVIAALTTPAFAFCLAKLLAVMWSTGDRGMEGRQWALYLLAVAAVDGLCSGTGRYLLESAAQSWVDSIRLSASQAILRQPKAWFMEDKNSPTAISETLDIHCEEMRNIIGRYVPIIVSVLTMVSISVVWSLIICWNLSLIALAPLPLIIVSLKCYACLGEHWEISCANSAEETGLLLEEVLTSIRTIRNYSLENHFLTKFTQCVQQSLGLGFKRAWYTCPLFGMYQAFSYGLTALMFYYGTSLLTRPGSVSVDTILQVLNLLLFSIGTATELLSAMPHITLSMASASRVLAYTHLTGGEIDPEVDSQGGRASPVPIRMRDLTFSYPVSGGKTVLNNLNLDIHPGKCTVLVGASGSGKSTILSLILGLYRPTPPFSLTYADTPSSMMNPRQLRATIGYVPQTPFLFPTTIAENIAYGLEESSPLRHLTNIRAAARDAGIDEYIASLPEGYSTLVGDGGTALSGGQAQRVTIARALVRRPALLVMDEPTSGLDAESAAQIRACVAELVTTWRTERRQAAVVMVTHNVEMMRVADTIVVIEDGCSVEQGAFEDLWFSGEAFRRLVRQREDDP